MKLYEIWNSSVAWSVLSRLKKNPKLAYRLLKFEKKVAAEIETCEQHRKTLVYEASGLEPPAEVTLKEGSPELAAYMAKFNEFMQGDSDLPWVGISMDELIDALGAEAGNVLSENDINLLEPFFAEPKLPAT